MLKEKQIQIENKAFERAHKLNSNESWKNGLSPPKYY